MNVDEAITGPQVLAAAQALLPEIAATAEMIEQERQLPQSLIDALVKAGLLRMAVPREVGGKECDPETIFRVIEAIAAVDGSTGWCVAVSTHSALNAGWLPTDEVREIFGKPEDSAAMVILAAGRAHAVAEGYRLSGRWSFASGSLHATWLILGGHVYEGESPRLGPNGQPEWHFFHVPKSAVTVHDTWHVAGLRGTGSNDVVVEDVFVPAQRTRPVAFPVPQHTAPLYAFGPGLLSLTCAAAALGIARGMLDALAQIAATKMPRAGGGVLLRDQPVAQYRIGIAEAQVRGARALLLELTREVWAEAGAGRYLSDRHRALMTWASAHATAMAAQAVDTAWDLAGGTAVFLGSPFERRFRDMHMVTQQFAVNASRYADGGRVFLSSPPVSA